MEPLRGPTMAIPYGEATDILLKHASGQAGQLVHEREEVPVGEAVGRICGEDYHSPVSTPTFDTSAMDGYAVNSAATKEASLGNPLTLWVQGTMAAGDAPKLLNGGCQDGLLPCAEIMTGAQFPNSTSEAAFDACIRLEDTIPVCLPDRPGKYVSIQKPAAPNQNRRPAGNDFRLGELIVAAGRTVRPHHIMALAAVGIRKIQVYPRLRVGVLSTGSELMSEKGGKLRNCIHDSNGPYISAVLQELGMHVVELGIIEDDCAEFEDYLSRKLAATRFDVLISTGAVSKGKFDFVRGGIESIGAKILFHRVKVRPGHPILFAQLPSQYREAGIPFFGLPGNPSAAAVCLRFFVVPYLLAVHRRPVEEPILARLGAPMMGEEKGYEQAPVLPAVPRHLDVFLHGRLKVGINGTKVQIAVDQGSSKVRPLLDADCWVRIPAREEDVPGRDIVETYPLHLPAIGG